MSPEIETNFTGALEESIEFLRQELSRYRQSNQLLRKVNAHLRQQLTIAHANDERFKEFCQQPLETFEHAEAVEDQANMGRLQVDYLDDDSSQA